MFTFTRFTNKDEKYDFDRTPKNRNSDFLSTLFNMGGNDLPGARDVSLISKLGADIAARVTFHKI